MSRDPDPAERFLSLLAATSSTITPRQLPGRILETVTSRLARQEQKYVSNISQECLKDKEFYFQEKENKEPDPMAGVQGSSSLAPLANQQVASMRRELEAEQENRGQLRSSSPGSRYGAPQMGYAQAHSELYQVQLS